jgi:hypothetical protein
MNAKQHPGQQIGTAEKPRGQAALKSKHRIDRPPIPLNRNHPAQNPVPGYRQIASWIAIASGREMFLAAGNDAMRNEQALALERDDLTRLEFARRTLANQQKIARPQGRKHAHAHDPEPKAGRTPGSSSRQRTRYAGTYDVLLLLLHAPLVA